ncbi:MAG: ABC transporter substrate-binding protein [Eubacteriales bacterium]|nr:ABC transporter substrate-binding protein [Eubacteriales bacterium]
MKRRQVLTLLMALAMAMSATACGGSETAQTQESVQAEEETQETDDGQAAEETEAAEETQEAQSQYPVTYSQNLDGNDYDFSIEQSPQRAVSMSQATTEMLLTLGLADKMAGTAFLEEEIYEPLAEEYAKVPVLAEQWPSYETFMAADPDFTTGWAVPFTKRAIEAATIVEQDIPIYVPESMLRTDATLDTCFDDMLMYGQIFDVEDTAEAYVAEQKEKLAAIQEKLADLPEKSVFVYDSEDDQPYTIYEGYTTNLLNLIGAKNILSGKGVDKTWDTASWEEIVAENPEYIIICDYGVSARNTDDFDQKVENLKANPALADVDAVKNENFIRVKLSEITPGVRSVDALERLAEEIHGITIE